MYFVLLFALALQRGIELVFAASNTAQLRRQGGQEVGAGHYPVMVLLHAAWFAALIWERSTGATALSLATVMMGWAMLFWGQGLRWWTITTLGRRWTTRVLVLPGSPVVEGGPFRLLRHPNYFGVLLEIVGVALIGGCWRTALFLGGAHTMFLLYRIGVEEQALREHGCLPIENNTP